MRLGQADDLKRRQKLTAYELAKQAKDPLWTKLVENRKKEKELIKNLIIQVLVIYINVKDYKVCRFEP